MLPDRVSNPGPLTYESGALPIALRDPLLVLNNRAQDVLFFNRTYYVIGQPCVSQLTFLFMDNSSYS